MPMPLDAKDMAGHQPGHDDEQPEIIIADDGGEIIE